MFKAAGSVTGIPREDMLLTIPPPQNAIVPVNATQAWLGARAGSVTTPTTAMIVGASITGGSACTDVLVNPYFEVWRARNIAAGYAVHGDTYLVTRSVKFSPNEVMSTPVFVHDISPASWKPVGPFHIADYTATGVSLATPQFHYQHPTKALGYRGRSFRVWVWSFGNQDGGPTGAGETFQWNVGPVGSPGANQTFTHSSTNDNFLRSFDITSATPGWVDADNLVINFGNQNTASKLTVVAVSSYPTTTVPNPGTGIHYSHFGYAGCCLGDLFAWGGANPSDKIAQWIGTVTGGGGTAYTIDTTKSPPWGPSILFVDMFDDVVAPNSAVTLASTPNTTVQLLQADGYLHGLRAITAAANFNPNSCTIINHIPNLPVGPTTDIGFPGVLHLENAIHFDEAVTSHAQANSQIVISSEARWGAHGLALKWQGAGNAHPKDAGHVDIANAIAYNCQI